MLSLIIDFESTGVDTKTARITEIGAAIVHTETLEIQDRFNCLVYEEDYIITPDVTKVTGITIELLKEIGVPFTKAIDLLSQKVNGSVKHVIAYNSKYDENLFAAEIRRHNLELHPTANWLLSAPWLCAMEDIETNYGYKCWKLSHLSLDYGVAVDPSKLHRAINDVELTVELMKAAKATITDMHKFHHTPWVYLGAAVRKPWEDGGESVAKAKARGFSWERAKGDDKVHPKRWVKKVKAHTVEAELNMIEFNVTVIEE